MVLAHRLKKHRGGIPAGSLARRFDSFIDAPKIFGQIHGQSIIPPRNGMKPKFAGLPFIAGATPILY
jgi:hypothetical protein